MQNEKGVHAESFCPWCKCEKKHMFNVFKIVHAGRGETLESLAEQYGVSVETLYFINVAFEDETYADCQDFKRRTFPDSEGVREPDVKTIAALKGFTNLPDGAHKGRGMKCSCTQCRIPVGTRIRVWHTWPARNHTEALIPDLDSMDRLVLCALHQLQRSGEFLANLLQGYVVAASNIEIFNKFCKSIQIQFRVKMQKGTNKIARPSFDGRSAKQFLKHRNEILDFMFPTTEYQYNVWTARIRNSGEPAELVADEDSEDDDDYEEANLVEAGPGEGGAARAEAEQTGARARAGAGAGGGGAGGGGGAARARAGAGAGRGGAGGGGGAARARAGAGAVEEAEGGVRPGRRHPAQKRSGSAWGDLFAAAQKETLEEMQKQNKRWKEIMDVRPPPRERRDGARQTEKRGCERERERERE